MPAERPILLSGPMVRAILDGRKTMTRRLATSPLAKCQPGDRLWVRETWQVPALCGVQYRATDSAPIGHWRPTLGPWRPSIHMPRWASRITLEVTGVKVERLQDISEEEALAEGICWSDAYEGFHTEDSRYYHRTSATASFAKLWECLHGDGSWEANPEVVCISFRRIEAPHG